MVLIVNPEAGKGRRRVIKYVDKFKDILESRNMEYEIIFTEYPSHATQIAKKYSGIKDTIIYSIGGDGTLNEVINGVVNTQAIVVNIPTGSGNDFIRTVTDLRDPIEIFEKSLISSPKNIDTIKVNGRYCINIASVGIDATVAYNVRSLKKIPLISGSLAYLISIFFTLIRYSSYKLKMTFDSKELVKEVLLIAIANGKYYGGGMKAVPDAVIDDGELDICMADNMKRLKIISLLGKYKKGKHVGLKEITFLKAKKVKIESNELLRINIDGEIIEDNTVEIEVVSDSLRIIEV